MQITIGGNTFILLKEKALYWKEYDALLIADPHFGKGTHFRLNGSYVPEKAFLKDLFVLKSLLESLNPSRLIILGDMFHSKYNDECIAFIDLMSDFPAIKTILIKGNHDILPSNCYDDMSVKIQDTFIYNNIILAHHPPDESDAANFYTLSGHIHPAYVVSGKGKQNIKMPCFVFGERRALLPAFGSFTGNKMVFMQEKEQIYVIAGAQIFEV